MKSKNAFLSIIFFLASLGCIQQVVAQGCNSNRPCKGGRYCYCSSPNHCKCIYFPSRLADPNTLNERKMEIGILPNPVSGSAEILFYLEQPGMLSLRLLDMQGRLIQIIVENYFDEGENQLTFNASGIDAGIYFLQVNGSGFSKTEKLILTK